MLCAGAAFFWGGKLYHFYQHPLQFILSVAEGHHQGKGYSLGFMGFRFVGLSPNRKPTRFYKIE